MPQTESGSKWPKIIIILVIIVFAIAVLITFFVGLGGLRQFFMWLFGILLGLSILFMLAYVFWLIFLKKEYKDIPQTFRKKLMQTAKLMKNQMLGDLYLSGDDKHNRIKIGKYAYLRIVLPKQHTEIIEDVPPEQQHLKKPKTVELTEPVPVDCFVIMKTKLWDILFGVPVFILVKPQDHNYSSIFNDVTINGFNLVPLDSQFFTVDRRNLDTDIIKGMATNYIREVVYEIFRDLDRLVKQAMNLDQQFQKDRQKDQEFQIPRIANIGGGERQQ
jgi:hypothetical protein